PRRLVCTETHPRSLRLEIVELDKRVLDAEYQRAGQRGVAGRAPDIRRYSKAHVPRELAVDVDVAARQVEHVEAVAMLQLGVVLHIGKDADTNDRVLRFGGGGGGGGSGGLRLGNTNCDQHQRERDDDALCHANVICKTATFPMNHRRVTSVLISGSGVPGGVRLQAAPQYTGRYGWSVRA